MYGYSTKESEDDVKRFFSNSDDSLGEDTHTSYSSGSKDAVSLLVNSDRISTPNKLGLKDGFESVHYQASNNIDIICAKFNFLKSFQ